MAASIPWGDLFVDVFPNAPYAALDSGSETPTWKFRRLLMIVHRAHTFAIPPLLLLHSGLSQAAQNRSQTSTTIKQKSSPLHPKVAYISLKVDNN